MSKKRDNGDEIVETLKNASAELEEDLLMARRAIAEMEARLAWSESRLKDAAEEARWKQSRQARERQANADGHPAEAA